MVSEINKPINLDGENLTLELERLVNENNELKNRLSLLEKKVHFFEVHQSLQRGIQGEKLIARLVDGLLSSPNSAYDITLNKDGMQIEVKYSSLSVPSKLAQTLRWAWYSPFGSSDSKHYDRLVLVGERDDRYASRYRDKESPYIIFDLPFDAVLNLTVKNGRTRSIYLTTNPRTARSNAAMLFAEYQVTSSDFTDRYAFFDINKESPK